MLELKNIRKIYTTGDTSLAALDGVSLCFRENEFVSILGPSGCGKTTLLNIIGGLDRYTDGDLSINGRSTKLFKDKDWDTYRNHSIGFVFQSYNLIPHQTVLANVELALTLSGVSKAERRAKATEALKKVGLGDHLHKKPNQMSGGQMQRVAIARALVNNPDILLADEPTGALDTQTSVQIMDLLKEVAQDRLVIMVTHNPELAKEYSTRIVSLSDGKVVNDTNPVTNEEYEALAKKDQEALAEVKKIKKSPSAQSNANAMSFRLVDSSLSFSKVTLSKEEYRTVAKKGKEAIKKAQKDKKASNKSSNEKALKVLNKKKSMSFGTAISLSFKNLLTKKGRTILTSFAGSIGIIGIALILALSNGINLFIEQVQEDTLSTYPLTIKKVTSDSSAVMDAMMNSKLDEDSTRDPNLIYVDDSMDKMVQAMTTTRPNDLVSFKEYIDKHYDSDLKKYVTDIQYTYDLNLKVYNAVKETNDEKKEVIDYRELGLQEILNNMGQFQSLGEMATSAGLFNAMSEMINNQELLDQQYEIVAGKWPANTEETYNEVVLVVGQDKSISKMTLYMLGLLDSEELQGVNFLEGYESQELEKKTHTFEELMGLDLYVVNTPDFFQKTDKTYPNDKNYYIWEDVRDNPEYDETTFIPQKGTKLKIVGIVCPKEESAAASISSPLGYTKALTDKLLKDTESNELIKQQRETPETNATTGRPHDLEEKEYSIDNIDELFATFDANTMSSISRLLGSRLAEQFANLPLTETDEDGNTTQPKLQSFIQYSTLLSTEQKQTLVASLFDKANEIAPMQIAMVYGMLNQGGVFNIDSKEDFVLCIPSIAQNPQQFGMLVGFLANICQTDEEAINGFYDQMQNMLPTLSLSKEMCVEYLRQIAKAENSSAEADSEAADIGMSVSDIILNNKFLMIKKEKI